MAVLYLDSFATYDTAGIPLRWTASGSPTISATAGRRGNPALVGSNISLVTRPIPTSTSVVIGYAIKPSTYASSQGVEICALLDSGSIQVRVIWNTGVLSIVNGNNAVLANGSTILAAGSTYYLEFKATISSSIAANSCVIRLNGAVECTATAATATKVTGNTSVNQVRIATGNFGDTPRFTLNDLYIFDGTGTKNNDFIGDRKVEATLVTGDGSSSDWTATGATDDWECVDDTSSDGDSTYVSSGTVGDYDLYTFGSLPSGVSDIDAVQVVMIARKDDAGTRSIAPSLNISSAAYDGTTVSLGDSYAAFTQAWDLNPATSAAWTDTEVNALEAGVKLVS